MDAVEFLRESDRMCRSYENCKGCHGKKSACLHRSSDIRKNAEGVVTTVEQWAKDHPVKTRQSEFLKMFPNAAMSKGFIDICPEKADENYSAEICCASISCEECRQKFWLTEVTDND